MADETIRAQTRQEMQFELERSRETSSRLLDSLARKIGVQRAAHYVQAHSVRDVVAGIDRFVRRRPLSSLAVAALAGFLLGLTRRGHRSTR